MPYHQHYYKALISILTLDPSIVQLEELHINITIITLDPNHWALNGRYCQHCYKTLIWTLNLHPSIVHQQCYKTSNA